jgi:replicative DNA helicase
MSIFQIPKKDRPFGIKSYIEILEEGLQYIEDRRQGKIKSLKLPWSGLNTSGVGGLEWGSMLTIGARPGSGKTMFVSQILREARILNPTQDFNILEFQFEMGPKQTASRDFVAQTGLDYNQVLSTDSALDEFYTKLLRQYVDDTKRFMSHGNYRAQINDSQSVSEMEKAIYAAYEGMGGKPMIVTIDHSWLIKKDVGEKEKIATLYNVVEMLMRVKNKLPIIVFMISQLNRSIDEPARKTPGTIGNYPTSSDIFGGDALMQGSDMVVVLTRPYKAEIEIYGRKEYTCKTDDIFCHILKSRNSADDNNLVFMKAEFSKQRMIEIPEPTPNNPTGGTRFGSRTANRRNNNQQTPDLDLN